MREGFWRMMQRIALGIPGFVGTGTVEGGQFTGEMAGVRVGWPIRPHGTAIFETVPIAGFYLFGQFWPQVLGIMGLAGMNFSKLVEKMDQEFGRTPEYDLLRGTVPMPIWGEDPFLGGSSLSGNSLRSWKRCGNSEFFYSVEAPVEAPFTMALIDPIELVRITTNMETEGTDAYEVVIVRLQAPDIDLAVAEEGIRGNYGDEFVGPFIAALGRWQDVRATVLESRVAKKDLVNYFGRLPDEEKLAILSAINALIDGFELTEFRRLIRMFPSERPPHTARRRLAIKRGSPAHKQLYQEEEFHMVTDASVVDDDLESAFWNALEDYGVLEC